MVRFLLWPTTFSVEEIGAFDETKRLPEGLLELQKPPEVSGKKRVVEIHYGKTIWKDLKKMDMYIYIIHSVMLYILHPTYIYIYIFTYVVCAGVKTPIGSVWYGMVITPTVVVQISTIRIPLSIWDYHPQFKKFRPWHMYVYICFYICKIAYVCTSSTAQGGGGSFKNRKRIGEIDCCEWRMSEQKHWPTD